MWKKMRNFVTVEMKENRPIGRSATDEGRDSGVDTKILGEDPGGRGKSAVDNLSRRGSERPPRRLREARVNGFPRKPYC